MRNDLPRLAAIAARLRMLKASLEPHRRYMRSLFYVPTEDNAATYHFYNPGYRHQLPSRAYNGFTQSEDIVAELNAISEVLNMMDEEQKRLPLYQRCYDCLRYIYRIHSGILQSEPEFWANYREREAGFLVEREARLNRVLDGLQGTLEEQGLAGLRL